MDLAPSVVRKIILEEHAQLRAKLAGIEEVIQRKEYSKLQNLLRELNHYFLKHIETEERILRPVLKDIDAWGAVRVDRMNQEHAEQRKRIQEIDRLISTRQPMDYLPQFMDFIGTLRLDIQTEEKECLHPEVLKDDPITVNTTSG